MSTIQIILTSLILFAGSCLQGAVAFGFALFAIPALIWGGIPLKGAVALMSMTLLVQVVVALYQLRHEIVWADIWFPLGIIYVSIPIGIGLLRVLSTLDPAVIKQVIGVVLLIAVGLQLVGRAKLKEKLHFGWTILAFGASGISSGMVSIGGPPIMLWVIAHDWSTQRARAFIFAQLFFGILLQIVLLYWSFGAEVLPNFGLGLAFAPVVALGSMLGVRIGSWLPYMRLRQVAFGLVIIIALLSIFSP